MITHSKEFIKKWNELIADYFNYDNFLDFVIIRDLIRRKHLVYPPFLSYSDRTCKDVEDLLQLGKNTNFQIKVLCNQDLKIGDQVTMRLDLLSKSYDQIRKEIFNQKCRNQIKKSEKSGLVVKIGSYELLDDFFYLFSSRMHSYGTPNFSIGFFKNILIHFNSGLICVYKNDEVVATSIFLIDKQIMIVPWAASNRSFNKFCPNHLMYSELIKYSIKLKLEIFDFGRSEYISGNTFNFKIKWGAQPFKIEVFSNKNQNIYKKYKLAVKIWKLIPRSVAIFLGSKLSKYLPDL